MRIPLRGRGPEGEEREEGEIINDQNFVLHKIGPQLSPGVLTYLQYHRKGIKTHTETCAVTRDGGSVLLPLRFAAKFAGIVSTTPAHRHGALPGPSNRAPRDQAGDPQFEGTPRWINLALS